MTRLARWLRLVVTCVAFVIGNPTPAVAAGVVDQIVLVANEETRAESEAENAAEEPTLAVDSAVEVERTPASFESPRLVSRRWLANCAFLL